MDTITMSAIDSGAMEQIVDTVITRHHAMLAPPPSPWANLFAGAPAWITLIAMMVIGFVSLNTRLATVEYQNQISIQDRVSIHATLDKSAETIAGIKTDLSDIKIELRQALQQQAAQRGTVYMPPASASTDTPN